MEKYLEKLVVFQFSLKIFSFFALKKWYRLVKIQTDFVAWLNLKLNRPQATTSTQELADTWVHLMPPDGRDFFKIDKIEADTAFVEIHLHCPLRGTGDVQACYQLMNYDRALIDKVGGNLVVLESQSNSGRSYCKLAIRKKGLSADDLIPAHKTV